MIGVAAVRSGSDSGDEGTGDEDTGSGENYDHSDGSRQKPLYQNSPVSVETSIYTTYYTTYYPT